jgi:hypothetical protein
MLGAAAAIWRKATGDRDRTEGEAQTCPPLRVVRDAAAGLLIGAMTGFFGVGGGFLVVPTLAIALALSMRLAVGTSLAIITATSFMALAAHLVAGRGLEAAATAAMTAACVVGALAVADARAVVSPLAEPGSYRAANDRMLAARRRFRRPARPVLSRRPAPRRAGGGRAGGDSRGARHQAASPRGAVPARLARGPRHLRLRR